MSQAAAELLNNKNKTILDDNTNSIKKLQDRQTPELVIALCGFIGSGVSSIGNLIKSVLQNFGYNEDNIVIIKISELIRKNYKIKPFLSKNYETITKMQEKGNELCKDHGNTYLAELAILEIAKERPDSNNDKLPEKRRRVTIIDSLKRPEEYEILHLVYGSMFYMVGVLCPEDIRKNRLNKIITNENIDKCLNVDRNEKENYGQKTAKTLSLSDFFVDNSGDTVNFSSNQIHRFIELVLGVPIHTPTNDEYGMFCAFSAALRSGCLSRQVGAAIMKEGTVISTGRNDVPKQNGGLFTEDDQEDDRCFKKHGQICNSNLKKQLFLDEYEKRISTFNLSKEIKHDILETLKNFSMLNNLVEYTRSVHAEMDAITSIARLGGQSLQGAILYCTTFPCHHCAKLILASGIKEVVYIEPYDKSLSYEMYYNSIAVDVSDSHYPDKLHMRYFYGVAPKRYIKLFKYDSRKDNNGAIKKTKYAELMPHHSIQLDNFIINETLIAEILQKYVADNSKLREDD